MLLPDPQLQTAIDRFPQRVKTWSLVVTMFGDAIQPAGGAIPLADITRALAPAGIAPGAVRTAMSRLASDGLVITERTGRSSIYRLTPAGAAEFLPAESRIYGPMTAQGRDVVLALCPPGLTAPQREALARKVRHGGGAMLSGVAIWQADAPPAPGWLDAHDLWPLTASPAPAPDWLANHLADPDMRETWDALEAWIQHLPLQPRDANSAMALRVLMIDGWRRAALRHPRLPEGWFPADWPAARLRAKVAGRYTRYVAASAGFFTPEQEAAAAAVLKTRFRMC